MPQDYYSLVTNKGLIKEAQAGQIGGNPINLTKLAVGDSSGSYYEPDPSATSLVNETYRADLTSTVLDANNPNQLIIEGVIDEEAGPFYVREVGIYDSDGDLFAIGKYPETFKVNSASGSGKRLYIRMILAFVSTPNVEIIISENINFDPNFETRINDEINNRLEKSNNLSDLEDIEIAKDNLNITDLIGSIVPFSFATPLSGWLKCNGAAISRITYAKLFDKIGTSYGVGNGSTTFNIPDLRGEFIRGFDDARGLDINRNLGTTQGDAIKSHNHNLNDNNNHPYYALSDENLGSNRGSDAIPYQGPSESGSDSGINHTSFFGANETRPRNISLLYCIKYN